MRTGISNIKPIGQHDRPVRPWTRQEGRRPGVLVIHEGLGLTSILRRSPHGSPGWVMPPSPWTITGGGKPLANPPTPAAHWRLDRRPGGIRAAPRLRSTCFKAQKEVDARGSPRSATVSARDGAGNRRSGADVQAIVGFHSGSHRPPARTPGTSRQVLVCIGADDPIIRPSTRRFRDRNEAAGIDWRLQLYGGAATVHQSAADSRGMPGFLYHEATDRRSWNAMIELFNETLSSECNGE